MTSGNEYRFTVTRDLHRALMIDAATRGVRAKKLAAAAVLELVDQGWPAAGIPPAAIPAGYHPVLARFSPAEIARIKDFAAGHDIRLAQVARIALAVKYAGVLAVANG